MMSIRLPLLAAHLQRFKDPVITSELCTLVTKQDHAGFNRLCQRLEIPAAYIEQLRNLIFSISPDLTWPPLWW